MPISCALLCNVGEEEQLKKQKKNKFIVTNNSNEFDRIFVIVPISKLEPYP